MMELTKIITTDVLVVGGGVAACTAAIEASKIGAKVVLMDKGMMGLSGSTPTSGGATNIALPVELGGDPQDSDELHLWDLVKGGEFLNDQEMAWLYIKGALTSLKEMESIGVQYFKDGQGRFVIFKSLGKSVPRGATPVKFGYGLMHALRKEVLHRGVKVYEWTPVVRIAGRKEKPSQALAIDTRSQRAIGVVAGAIVLATGSATKLYRYHSASFPTTGDGYALAFSAGAELLNMEMVEFTIVPELKGKPVYAGGITPLLGYGATLHNARGERFMARYDPLLMERTFRAKLVMAVQQEILEGRGPILMDARSIDPQSHIQIEDVRKKLRAARIDMRRELFPWVPAAHSYLGGVRIDKTCSTSIPGIYAAGEVAGHGLVFGADRAGTAVAAGQVLGELAGRSGSLYALRERNSFREKDFTLDFPESPNRGGEGNSEDLEMSLRELAWNGIGIVRDHRSLENFLIALEGIRQENVSSSGLSETLRLWDIRNLCLSGEMVARSALLREESRGQHYRSDFPFRDDKKWLQWTKISNCDGKLDLGTVAIPWERYPIKPPD